MPRKSVMECRWILLLQATAHSSTIYGCKKSYFLLGPGGKEKCFGVSNVTFQISTTTDRPAMQGHEKILLASDHAQPPCTHLCTEELLLHHAAPPFSGHRGVMTRRISVEFNYLGPGFRFAEPGITEP